MSGKPFSSALATRTVEAAPARKDTTPDDAATSAAVEKASIGNLKQTWTSRGLAYDLADKSKFEGDYFLRRATQVKNVWVPYGA